MRAQDLGDFQLQLTTLMHFRLRLGFAERTWSQGASYPWASPAHATAAQEATQAATSEANEVETFVVKRKGLWSQEWYPERLDQCRERNPAVLPGQRYFSDCQKCITYKQTGFSMKDSVVYI